MNITWQGSKEFPTCDGWIPRLQTRATKIARVTSAINEVRSAWGIATHLQGLPLVVIYSAVSLAVGAAAMGILLLALPWVLGVPAAMAGLLIVLSSYVFLLLRVLS